MATPSGLPSAQRSDNQLGGAESYERLPPYECSVHASAEFWMKPEKSSLVDKSRSRRWTRIHAEIQGTMLFIHSRPPESISLFRKTCTFVTRTKNCHARARAFTLQAAEAGLASDYVMRDHVFRVRVESEQFLLHTGDVSTCVEWVNQLNAAIDISLALDEREMPAYPSVTRPTRTLRTTTITDRIPSRLGAQNDTEYLQSPSFGASTNKPGSQEVVSFPKTWNSGHRANSYRRSSRHSERYLESLEYADPRKYNFVVVRSTRN